MSIRFKLMMLLAGVALLPLIFFGWINQRATRDLGLEIAAQSRQMLTERLSRHVSETARTQAMILRHQRTIVELAVELLAERAELSLAAAPPLDPPIYPAARLEDADRAPPGTTLSAEHPRKRREGGFEPLPINEQALSFVLAPRVSASAVADDVARLSGLLPTAKLVYSANRDLLFWSYTALEGGVHVAYPAHGRYPDSYDPRERPWYRTARMAREAVWTYPIVDATTRQIIITRARPIFRADGAFAGVTAIDVPVLALLRDIAAVVGTSDRTEAFLVSLEERPENRETGLRILAHRAYDRRSWQGDFEPSWLESDDSAALAAVVAELRDGKPLTRRLRYRVQEAIWAFAPVDDDRTQLLIILPVSEIAAEAAKVESEVFAATRRHLIISALVLGVVATAVAVIAVFSARTVTRPLQVLAGAARDLAAGNFEIEAAVRGRDEIGQLGETFDAMVPRLRDHIEVRRALSVADEIQKNLLPTASPIVPGFDIAGFSDYCEATGGDYFDYIDLSSVSADAVGVAVGDVSGHGVSAALMMATVRAALRSRAASAWSMDAGGPARLMTDLNRQIAADAHRGQFMTLFYMICDARSGWLRWVNAGHAPPLVFDRAAQGFDEPATDDIPLGIEPEWPYEEHRLRLDGTPRIIVSATDGLWESRGPDGIMFGRDRLRDVVRRHTDASAQDLCTAVREAVRRFRSGCPMADDVTLVVVKTR